MTKETIQPESETLKNIIKPFSFQSRYANEKNHHKTFLCSSKICETKKTFMNLSLLKQDMRKEENLHEPFSAQARYAKRSSVAYLRPSESHPLTLVSEASPLPSHHIYRITNRSYKPGAEPKNQEQKGRSANPCITYPKRNKTKKENKNYNLYAFFIFIKAHIQKKHLLLLFHKWPAKAAKITHLPAKHT